MPEQRVLEILGEPSKTQTHVEKMILPDNRPSVRTSSEYLWVGHECTIRLWVEKTDVGIMSGEMVFDDGTDENVPHRETFLGRVRQWMSF
jgi:hypothetical protein